MSQVTLIYNEEELHWFFDNILPPLEPTEVYFVSLSARSKYLTEEEKPNYIFSHNEMFAKTILRERSWSSFSRAIRRYECDERGYTTTNGKSVPPHTIVCYININPSNSLKALNDFNKVVNEYMFELSRVTMKGLSAKNILDRLSKIDNNMLTSYQKATSTRHWIDIDMDVEKDFKIYEDTEFKQWIESKGIKTYYWLDTHSGYHLLIKKADLKFNPEDICDMALKQYGSWLERQYTEKSLATYEDWKQRLSECEIVVNRNMMVPLAGTYQGGYPVSVLNKGTV